MKNLYLILYIFILASNISFGQETLPIYTDYLTDNIYLIHPTAAGISNFGKIRLTGRKQWLDYKNAPELQTLSFHMPIEENTAIGAVFYNDKNGHFKQTGGQLSYAYHLNFDNQQINQLSFGLSLLFINNRLDTRDFTQQDSGVNTNLNSNNYFNTDVSIAYRNQDFFSFYTLKNLLEAKRKLFDNGIESNNLRRHLLTLGYFFNDNKNLLIKFQPSLMMQYIEQTQETFIDTNIKVFLPIEKGEFWGGISYRTNLDKNIIEPSNYLTPFIGLKFVNFVFSYSYAEQFNNTTFTKGGFHQITLGYNFTIHKYKTATWDL